MEVHELENQLNALKRSRGAAALDGNLRQFGDRKARSRDRSAHRCGGRKGPARPGSIRGRLRDSAEGEASRTREREIQLSSGCRRSAQHVRGAAAAISRMLAAIEKMARLAYEITGATVPVALARLDLMSRAGNWVSAIMGGTIPGARARLGGAQWHPGPFNAQQDWHAAESALLDKHLQPIIDERTQV